MGQKDKYNQEYFDMTFDKLIPVEENQEESKGVPKDEIVKLLNYLVTGGV
tara:strand:+ start:665 stop:814 length:150 start_codon:yes stop_codon:yes gene_type:complete